MLKDRSYTHGSRMVGLEQVNGHFNDTFSGMHSKRSFTLQPEQVSGVLTPLYHTDRLE